MRAPSSARTPPGPRVVVAVHDVAPSTAADVRWLLERLDAMGAAPRVLKVIPRAEDREALADDQALVELLRAEVAAGSEVVLHGWTHRAVGPLRGPALARLRARLFAGPGAEFLTVSPGEAAARIEAGRAALAAVGLSASGFCAPGWLAPPELPGMLAARGFRYLVSVAALHDLRRGRSRTIPAIGYMGAGPRQERLVDIERRLVLTARPWLPDLRVYLHPQGARTSPACAASLTALAGLLRERRPVTYTELLDA